MGFRVTALLLLLPFLAAAQAGSSASQESSKVAFYLQRYSIPDARPSTTQQVLSFVQKLDAKRASFKKDKDFLAYVFGRTHQRFLKHYAEFPSFGETLNTGTYNCLTGTALYALLLDHFGYDFEMVETNYHIFILAHTREGNILLETTDPMHGFVTDPKEVEKRIAEYKENKNNAADPSQPGYQYNFNLYNSVDLDQLLGLLHYNRSIAEYNSQQLAPAVAELAKAIESYRSPRILEFAELVMFTVMSSDLEATVKEKCLQRLFAIRKIQSEISASVN